MKIKWVIPLFWYPLGSLIKRQEFLKNAEVVAQEPWALHRARAWIQQLVEQNVANAHHWPQHLQFIFNAEVCERLSVGIMPELSSVEYEFAPDAAPHG